MISEARRSTLKTILLVVASGIGGIVIFVVAVIGFMSYKLSTPGSRIEIPSEKTVSKAPSITDAARFEGSYGIYTRDFLTPTKAVLEAGPGRLAGRITSGGKPVEGVRLRLALNGSVMSQWGTSKADGKYEVGVPYAQYRIDGYELDMQSADKHLAGKIDNPHNPHGSGILVVGDGRPGRGLDLDYVDPVKKKGPKGDVSLAKPVVISWEPYPGATSYELQLIEQKDPGGFMSEKRLFDWHQRPKVTGTSFDLSREAGALKKGFYYRVEIDALDADRLTLSNTARKYDRPDFFVVD